MNSLRFKSVFIAALLIVSSSMAENVFAQGRAGRGGRGSAARGGGSHLNSGSASRGNSSSTFRGGSQRNFSRGNNTAYRSGSRTFYRRPGGLRGRAGIYAGRRFGSRSYYRPGFYGRAYRRPYCGYYNYYRPYLGFSLSVLPFGYYPFFYGDAQYYYSGGLYYQQHDKEYKVVVPPVGAEVPNLPDGATQITIDGREYYEYKGVYYSPTEKADGKTAYIIAGKEGVLNTADGDLNAATGARIGDEVDQLPEGTREITLKGEKLYVSEDGVYYEEIVQGDRKIFRVVGI